jgi:hypothetical protein
LLPAGAAGMFEPEVDSKAVAAVEVEVIHKVAVVIE